MKKGKREIMEETELLNKENIKSFGEKNNYRYPGILETDTIKPTEIKEK